MDLHAKITVSGITDANVKVHMVYADDTYLQTHACDRYTAQSSSTSRAGFESTSELALTANPKAWKTHWYIDEATPSTPPTSISALLLKIDLYHIVNTAQVHLGNLHLMRRTVNYSPICYETQDDPTIFAVGKAYIGFGIKPTMHILPVTTDAPTSAWKWIKVMELQANFALCL